MLKNGWETFINNLVSSRLAKGYFNPNICAFVVVFSDKINAAIKDIEQRLYIG